VTTREARYAGSWYPGAPRALRTDIERYLSAVDDFAPPRPVRALVSPHAGYVYSGPTAAYGYACLERDRYRTVVVLAPSHRVPFSGVAPMATGSYRTPLGDIVVDDDFCRLAFDGWKAAHDVLPAHAHEHSLEMQLPFLQCVLGAFTLVPVIIGGHDFALADELGRRLHEAIGERDDVLVVASTDLSHFHPAAQAEVLDGRAAGYIERLDGEGLFAAERAGSCELCGVMPVVGTLCLARRWGDAAVAVRSYTHSGRVTGDTSSVVGYLSAVIW